MFDVKKIRDDFPMINNNQNMIYFDSGATSLKPNCVLNKVNEFYTNSTTNVHRGDYTLSFNVSKQYDNVRNIVKEYINATSSKEIIFTSGATQSLNNIAISYGYENLNENDVILTTFVEHASSVLPWFEVSNKTKAKIEFIPLNSDGTFNIELYKECFEKFNVKVVAITYISNVLGYIYPIKEITKFAHENGAIVTVDATQAAPHIKIDVQDLDVDFLSFSAHKMLGPSGVGVMYGKYELLEKIKPVYYGGASNARFNKEKQLILKDIPDRFESGTPNAEGVLGFGEAINYIQKIGMNNIVEYEKELKNYFIEKISKLDNVILYNEKTDCCLISFNIKDIFAQDVASYLNAKGICVRSGNHCAKLIDNVIGTQDSVRASLYIYNTKEEIDYFIEILKDITLEKCIEVVI